MAAFSYQQPPSFVDSIFYPNSPVGVPSLIEDMNGCCYPSHSLHGSCSYENDTKVIVNEHQFDSVSSIEHKTESSPLVIHEVESTQKSSNLPQQKNDMKKKRKTKAKTCADSAHSKCLNEAKVKMQRKCDVGFKTTEKEKPTGVENEKKVSEGTPSGFIHVRARRGQATDSHSLAERVRREKISERMKLLQELVPGCEKVTGKALMLDEIINYVQSLQHQVEFLSMKLASLNPVPYDFTVDFQGYIPEPENMSSIPSHFPQVVNQNYQASFNNSSGATFPELENYGLLDSEVSVSVHHGQQRPNNTVSQDNASLIWRGEEQRQSFLNEVGYDLCSF